MSEISIFRFGTQRANGFSPVTCSPDCYHSEVESFHWLDFRRAFERHFTQCRIASASDSWEPAYFFGSAFLYRIFLVIHKLLPRAFGTATMFFLQKKGAA